MVVFDKITNFIRNAKKRMFVNLHVKCQGKITLYKVIPIAIYTKKHFEKQSKLIQNTDDIMKDLLALLR